MNSILVATDFSNDAYCALFYIAKLMENRSCTFHILNVYDENTPLDHRKSKLFNKKKRLKEIATESKERLINTCHKIVMDTENTKHRFETISKEGILDKVMTEIIDQNEINLVVMGSKGEMGAKEIFWGSNTIHAVNAIHQCPVLAVPKQIDYTAPQEIAFITDFKEGCTKMTITPLLHLASLTDASIRVMHINEEEILSTEQESHRKLLELSLKDTVHSFHWLPEFDDKALVINSFIEKMNIDLFAMVHHQRSYFEKLTREPVIKDLSMYSEIPFLILPHKF